MGKKRSEDIVLKRVDRLEPGMTVGRDIHSEHGTRLLSAGDELTYEDIERLKEWQKRSIYVQEPSDNDDSSNLLPAS